MHPFPPFPALILSLTVSIKASSVARNDSSNWVDTRDNCLLASCGVAGSPYSSMAEHHRDVHKSPWLVESLFPSGDGR